MKGVNFFMITEIIIKYWVEFLLGLIATGLGIVAKKFHSLYKAEQKHQKTEEQKKFYSDLENVVERAATQSRANETKLQEQIDIVREGVLSLQGEIFKEKCHRFLKPDCDFTLAEFEEIENEHIVYNKLGGNCTGDKLFTLVEKKASNILTDDK